MSWYIITSKYNVCHNPFYGNYNGTGITAICQIGNGTGHDISLPVNIRHNHFLWKLYNGTYLLSICQFRKQAGHDISLGVNQ